MENPLFDVPEESHYVPIENYPFMQCTWERRLSNDFTTLSDSAD